MCRLWQVPLDGRKPVCGSACRAEKLGMMEEVKKKLEMV